MTLFDRPNSSQQAAETSLFYFVLGHKSQRSGQLKRWLSIRMPLYDSTKDIVIPLLAMVISAFVAFVTARYTLQKERLTGHARLLDVTRRYFLSVFNSLDANGRVKTDSLSKEMHIEELAAVIRDVDSIVSNPYFSGLVETHPLISKLSVQARRELVEHRHTKGFALNRGSIEAFGNLNALLLKDKLASPLDVAIAERTIALSQFS